VNLR
jgi:hypothetical protein